MEEGTVKEREKETEGWRKEVRIEGESPVTVESG